ncbi:hypothetical protein GCM10017612_42730 [Novosphingobium resinovorum]|nr:hypothetical protein GCM10017612_42730 [Novosphingobium resinovorum]
MAQDAALARGRLSQHRVEGKHQRCGQQIDELNDHLAVTPAEDAVLVLKPNCIYPGLVDPAGDAGIILRIAARDGVRYVRIFKRAFRIIQRINVHRDFPMKFAKLLKYVGRERGDTAFARDEIAYKCHTHLFLRFCATSLEDGMDVSDFAPELRVLGKRQAYHVQTLNEK